MTEKKPSQYPGMEAAISAERTLFRSGDPENDSISTTKVHPYETSPSKRLKPTYREQFLESCQDEYDATMEAYHQIYSSPSDRPKYALEHCREFAYFALDKTSGDVKVMSNGCRERWCPMCAGQKAHYAKESVMDWLATLEQPRFLTLTIEHSDEPLLPQIEHLQDSFRRLRTRVFWKTKVDGGIWFLQVHRSKSSGLWHPHLHILLEGKYLESGELSELWKLVSYGSYILKIKKVWDVEYAAKYVARYTARPAKLADMALDDRVELISSLRRKRMGGTFGTGKKVVLTPPKIESNADWEHIDYYDNIVEKAKTDKNAQSILKAYALGYPISDELFEKYTGRPLHYECVMKEKIVDKQLYLDFYNST